MWHNLKIFIVGSSRSGTTMMGLILGNHPLIYTFPHELHFFEQLWSPRDKNLALSKDKAVFLTAKLMCIYKNGYLTQGDHRAFMNEAEDIVDKIPENILSPDKIFEFFMHHIALQNGKVIPCDHTPRNLFYSREIFEFYPNTRIINMVRDPRDVVLSQKKKWKVHFLGGKKYNPLNETFRTWINYHPITMSKLWNASIRYAENFLSDSRVMSVRFEKLLYEPEATIYSICDFIGISFDKKMLEVPQIGSSFVQYHPGKKGIDKDRAQNWKKGGLNPSEIYICQKVNLTLMQKYGYDSIDCHPNILTLIYYICSFPIKLLLSFFVNMKRMKSFTDTIKRRLNM